jgi:hypothetical protein
MSVERDGPPALAIEVASDTTWAYDIDDAAGKAAGYRAIGVHEYLVFDPTGAYLGAPCQAWRFAGGGQETWTAGADGRFVSETLGIAFRPEGVFLRVFDASGRSPPARSASWRLPRYALSYWHCARGRTQATAGPSRMRLSRNPPKQTAFWRRPAAA